MNKLMLIFATLVVIVAGSGVVIRDSIAGARKCAFQVYQYNGKTRIDIVVESRRFSYGNDLERAAKVANDLKMAGVCESFDN